MRLTPEQQALAAENIGLARMTAYKFQRTCAIYGIGWDDAFSIACIGLMKATRTFDPTQATASTYLTRGCELAILIELRKLRRAASYGALRTVSLQTPYMADRAGGEITYEDTLTDDAPDVADVAIGRVVAPQILDVLTRNTTSAQKHILSLRAHGMGQRQIARTVGRSQAWVSRELTACRKIAD